MVVVASPATIPTATGISSASTPRGEAQTSIAALTVGKYSGTTTQANGINDSGQVVGSGNLPNGVGNRAFIITGGNLTMIAPLGGGNPATSSLANWANAISNTGTVVGSSELVSGGLQEAYYTDKNGTPQALTTRNAAGNFQSSTTALAIDNNGDIVGSGTVGGAQHAFFASESAGPLVNLGTLGNATSSKALGVNDYGLVVGQSGGRAFLDGVGGPGLYDLNSLSISTDGSSWLLVEATGINDSDQISGEGYVNGVLHGFVLNPIPGQPIFSQPGTVPTPPALVLSAVGLAIAGGWSRWRLRRVRSEDPGAV